MKLELIDQFNPDFLDQFSKVPSPEMLFDMLVSAATKEGFNWVCYGALNYEAPARLAGSRPPVIASNYPPLWQDHYFQQKYHQHDPVIARALTRTGPFLWDILDRNGELGARQKLILDEARAVGLKSGVSMPILTSEEKVALLSFASSNNITVKKGKIKYFSFLATKFHMAFSNRVKNVEYTPSTIGLSARERECLVWTAYGKSSWDISMILKISENTVNFHIKNSMKKLGTSSRTVAVLKAIRRNIIDFPDL